MMRVMLLPFMAIVLNGCQTTGSMSNYGNDLDGQVFAKADLMARSNSTARGVAWFAKRGDDIAVTVKVDHVSPGKHGIHLHENGDCSAPDASSAGDHFNPAKLTHGHPDPQHYHMGDLGNITVDESGHGVLHLIIPAKEFNQHFHDWSIIVGRSVILHQDADDLTSQPAGNSGTRIACGVVTKVRE